MEWEVKTKPAKEVPGFCGTLMKANASTTPMLPLACDARIVPVSVNPLGVGKLETAPASIEVDEDKVFNVACSP
jgi:hypothetical protein